jgi:hypothetical protein
MIEIEPTSEAYHVLKLALSTGRMVRIEERRDGIAVKSGEGMWTYTMPTREDRDARTFKRGECDHLICQQCGGHKDFREFWQHDGEPGDSRNQSTCTCCKHCNDPRGH